MLKFIALILCVSLLGCSPSPLKTPEEIQAKMELISREMDRAARDKDDIEASRLFGFLQGLLWTVNKK